MGRNERSDPDMRTANFKFSCDVYREGVYMPYACCFHRAVCVLPLLRINICVYPLVLLLRKSVIYCSFPYNGVPYSCVKLMILCCNWCIITSVILPFPAHHRLSARVRCIERTPLKAAFVFHLQAGRAYWPPGAPGHSRWIGHRSEEELPHIRHCF